MPYGSTNGGTAGGGLTGGVPGKGIGGRKTLEKKKSVSYHSTQSDMVFSISSATASSPTNSMPKTVEVINSGSTPLYVIVGYEKYTGPSGGTPTGVEYVHTLLMPDEIYYPAVRAVIQTGSLENDMIIGSSANNTEPSSENSGLLWKDIAADLGGNVNATTDPITITTASNHTNYFRVGDLVQIGRGTSQTDLTESNHYREILRVQDITSTTEMVCERALYGTDAGDSDSTNWNQGHASGFPIFLPFFNAYYDVDKYSVAQTDSAGNFKAYNYFARGRSSSGEYGITPGSVAIKFYESGYQSLGLSGITPATNSGLAASEILKLDIQVDSNPLFQDLTFTLDSSNVNFGGTNGVISKIQSALDTQFYTAGNLFEKRVTVGIVDGDIRFTSGSHLSTSAILLADTGDSDTLIDASANGRIPASGDIPDPIAAKFPDDVTYDKVTYATSHNVGAFCVDDGRGNLIGKCSGSINYETGEFNLRGAPPNAEMAFSCNDKGAFSGMMNSELDNGRENAIRDIYVNTPAQHSSGSITVNAYE